MEGATALSSAWGVDDYSDDYIVYICYIKDSDHYYSYYGYIDGSWHSLDLEFAEEDSNGNPYGRISFFTDGGMYYSAVFAEEEVLERDPPTSSEPDNPIVNDYPTTT